MSAADSRFSISDNAVGDEAGAPFSAVSAGRVEPFGPPPLHWRTRLSTLPGLFSTPQSAWAADWFTPMPITKTTEFAKSGSVRGDWFVVDASDKTLGRLATQIAHRLKG